MKYQVDQRNYHFARSAALAMTMVNLKDQQYFQLNDRYFRRISPFHQHKYYRFNATAFFLQLFEGFRCAHILDQPESPIWSEWGL